MDLTILIRKQSSSETNPANQYGLGDYLILTKGFLILNTLENALFKSSDKPKLIAVLILTIFWRPEAF